MKFFAVSLMVVFPAAGIAADCVDVSPEQSGLHFEVEQAGSEFAGDFTSFGGEVCMNDGAIVSIEAWLDPASVKTGLPELDAALKGKEFFDVEKFPRATFTSENIEQAGDKLVARGQLDIKGVQRAEDVPFKLVDSENGRELSGEFKIDRLDYNIGTGEWKDTTWLAAGVVVVFDTFLPSP